MVDCGASEAVVETKVEIVSEAGIFADRAPSEDAWPSTDVENDVTDGLEGAVAWAEMFVSEDSVAELGVNVPKLYVGLKDEGVAELLLTIMTEPVPSPLDVGAGTSPVLEVLGLVISTGPALEKL